VRPCFDSPRDAADRGDVAGSAVEAFNLERRRSEPRLQMLNGIEFRRDEIEREPADEDRHGYDT
jgi:hypothetical protein